MKINNSGKYSKNHYKKIDKIVDSHIKIEGKSLYFC